MTLEEILAKAREALEKEEYSTALDRISMALEINSNSIEAWDIRGEAYQRLNEYSKAIESLNQVTSLDPKYCLAWYNKGNVHAKLKEYENAISCYGRTIDLDPSFDLAWKRKGNAYSRIMKYEEALFCYAQATDLDPRCAGTWYNRGIAHGKLKEYEKALACYTRATDLNPGFVLAWNNKGNVYSNLKEYEETISCFNWVNFLDSGFSPGWNGKGTAYISLKEYEKAISCFNRAIILDPAFALAWHNKGDAYIGLKEYEKAISCYDRAIQLDPGFFESWNNKGYAYIRLMEYEEALFCYNRAIDLNSGYARAWKTKGSILIELDRPQEAAACYRRAFLEDPHTFNLVDLVRKYKEHLSDPLFVQRIFKDFPALRMFPDLNTYADETQSKVSDMLLFIEAINRGGFNLGEKEALMTTGKIFYYYGDSEMARKCFDQLDDLDDQDIGIKYYYIISLQALAKTDEAKAIFNYVLEHYKEWIEASGDKTYQKYYAAIILGLLENYHKALHILEALKETFLPALYLKYWTERKLNKKEASETLIVILKQEEKMLVQDYRGFLFPHAMGEIFVDETTKVISPVQYHAVSQEIWEPIQMVLKMAEEAARNPENDLPAVNSRLKHSGDYYRSVPFMGGLKLKKEFLTNLHNFLDARRHSELQEMAKSHLRQVSNLKWRNYLLLDQQKIELDECERCVAESLEFMRTGYVEEYSDINQILIYFLLTRKLKPDAFFLLAAFTAFLANLERKTISEKSVLNKVKKVIFLTKVASTINAYTIGIVFTLSALFDMSVNELNNYGPDVLDAYLDSLGSRPLSYVDFKMRYSEFISSEYSRLGVEEFERVYSLKNIFEQSSI